MWKTFDVIEVKIPKQKLQVFAAIHIMPETDLDTFYLGLVRALPELFCSQRVKF